jgi:hypothetical protein
MAAHHAIGARLLPYDIISIGRRPRAPFGGQAVKLPGLAIRAWIIKLLATRQDLFPPTPYGGKMRRHIHKEAVCGEGTERPS